MVLSLLLYIYYRTDRLNTKEIILISNRFIKKYCRDDISKIKNYDKAISDTTQIWHCHHINELTYTREQLIQMNMYYNRPADEFIFLTKSEHLKLHRNHCVGEEERRNKYRLSCEGRPSPFKGHKSKFKGIPRDETIKKSISNTCKGRKLITGSDGRRHWSK